MDAGVKASHLESAAWNSDWISDRNSSILRSSLPCWSLLSSRNSTMLVLMSCAVLRVASTIRRVSFPSTLVCCHVFRSRCTVASKTVCLALPIRSHISPTFAASTFDNCLASLLRTRTLCVRNTNVLCTEILWSAVGNYRSYPCASD